MADVAVTVTSLTANALSTALDTTTYSVATGNYAVIAAEGATRGLILTFDGDAASTVTLISGDQPPSENSGNGDSAALTIANGKQYVLELEAGRFVQDDGTVRILVGGTGPVNVFAYAAAKGN